MKAPFKNIILIILFACIIKANLNCAASVIAAFIPLIGAAPWVNVTNPDNNHFNFITIDNPNSNTSTFDGNEHFNDGNSDSSFHFTGSFTNHNIQFKYDSNTGSRSGKNYKGTINDPSTQITLSSPDGLPSLTLIKR